MRYRVAISLPLVAGSLLVCTSARAADPTPKVYDPGLRLQLFAEAPDIVTPIGTTFDAKGRLLVIESHTHQRDKNYKGPNKDRIRILEDTDGGGRANRFRTFHEGTEFTMSLARGAEGWIYVATRMKIFRIRDTDGDDVADEEQELLHLETKGNYPHNGLSGLAFDNHGELYFGIGENLGEPWVLVAKDGSRLRGAGEGGVFHCRADGSDPRRVAVGLWNPFGICVDPLDRVFAVDNDPDGCPPCRLVQIVPTGDYGFNFKYGRSGKHPLQAWNGELPGTLPMVAATGEAPCAVLPYHGQLWSTSWGDHRIERFKLIPWGSSFKANREMVVEGTDNFRPVGLTIGPDDSLYFTDWVDKSYPVHGKGRVWKLSWTGKSSRDNWPETGKAIKADDRFARQAEVAKLVATRQATWQQARTTADPAQRLVQLQALRWQERAASAAQPSAVDELAHFLTDDDLAIRMYVMRWIADERINPLHQQLVTSIQGVPRVTPEFFFTWAAAIEILDRGVPITSPKEPNPYLIQAALDPKMSIELRTLALRFSPPSHPRLTTPQLTEWSKSENTSFRREAVRTLVLRDTADVDPSLAQLAVDVRADAPLRADAVAGLISRAANHRELLKKLSRDEVAAVRSEALRAIGIIDSQTAETEPKPAPTDIDAWLKLTEQAGDADAGWRVFFTAANGRCAACHRFDGRGNAVGPDLTGIGRRLDRRRVLESILQPSREIAPQYVAWNIATDDGRVLLGLSQGFNDAGTREFFLGSDGKSFDLDVREIAVRKMSTVSLMPDGLEKSLTVQDLRDVLALLHSGP